MGVIDIISGFLELLLAKNVLYWKILSEDLIASIYSKRFHSLHAAQIIVVHDNCFAQISIINRENRLFNPLLIYLIWNLSSFLCACITSDLLWHLLWTFSLWFITFFRSNILIIVKIASSRSFLRTTKMLSRFWVCPLFLVNDCIHRCIWRAVVVDVCFIMMPSFLLYIIVMMWLILEWMTRRRIHLKRSVNYFAVSLKFK